MSGLDITPLMSLSTVRLQPVPPLHTLSREEALSERKGCCTGPTTNAKRARVGPWLLAHAQVPVPAQAGSANTLGLRQTTLQVLGLLEGLKALGAPTHITSYQRGGHYKVKHTALHMADVEKVKRHMGFGNWTLSWQPTT